MWAEDKRESTPTMPIDRLPGQRPPGLKVPSLSPNPPVPTPEPIVRDPAEPAFAGREGLDPVRYGDWESKGVAIDF